jgi:hypothetical protein
MSLDMDILGDSVRTFGNPLEQYCEACKKKTIIHESIHRKQPSIEVTWRCTSCGWRRTMIGPIYLWPEMR